MQDYATIVTILVLGATCGCNNSPVAGLSNDDSRHQHEHVQPECAECAHDHCRSESLWHHGTSWRYGQLRFDCSIIGNARRSTELVDGAGQPRAIFCR